MVSPLPRTPSRRDSSPFSFSPSPSQYLNYASEQSCSSPTPLPANISRIPTTISPYEYQLTHFGAGAPAPDASFALKTGFRSFGMLTAAETLLSVQSGSTSSNALPTPPPSNANSVERRHRTYEGLQSPSRLTWPSKLASSAFVSPCGQRATGSRRFLDSVNPTRFGSGAMSTASLSFSPSSFNQNSSQSSSQFTTVGWQEPQTPRSSERQKRSRQDMEGFILSSPVVLNPFSPDSLSRAQKFPCTPHRLVSRGSFPSAFGDGFNLSSPGFDLRYPDTLQLSTPRGLHSTQIEDDSPVLRQSQQGTEYTFLANGRTKIEDPNVDSDGESGLYASQSGSATLVNRSSPIFSDDEDRLMSSDDELPLSTRPAPFALSASRSPDAVLPVRTPNESSDMDAFVEETSNTSSKLPRSRLVGHNRKVHPPSFTFKDRRILNNPVTALTSPRASKSVAERLISTIATSWSPRRRNPNTARFQASSPGGAGVPPESPLSSVPSTPSSSVVAASPIQIPPTPVNKKNGRIETGSVFTIGTSPIAGRTTRAQTRALAAVLRPFNDFKSSAVSSSISASKSQEGTSIRKRRRHEVASAQTERQRKRAKMSISENSKEAAEEDLESASLGEESSEDEDKTSMVTDQKCNVGCRTFPSPISLHSSFPAFYRKFAVPEDNFSTSTLPGAVKNLPRSPLDLYTPRWVKGRGTTKVGLCPICAEAPSRGGEGKKLWLSMKFSAFNYHMQYYHGISPSTGMPFSPPVGFMHTTHLPQSKPGFKSKHERSQIEQGKCHKCNKWVAVEGVKDVEVKVKEIFWWKHAAACHQRSTIPGEEDVFLDDEIYRMALAAVKDDQDSDPGLVKPEDP